MAPDLAIARPLIRAVMRLRYFIGALLLLSANGSLAEPCSTLGEQLQADEPRVKRFIGSLRASEKTSGIRLCDNTELFKDWVFLGRAANFDDSQFVYLFSEGGRRRAVVWIEPRGTPIPTPGCPNNPKCVNEDEAALIISGDVYTWMEIRPGEAIVILLHPPKEWNAA